MLDFYSQLLEDRWKLNEIDEMDFFYYLDVLIYKSKEKEKKGFAYIDQVF